MRLCRRLGLLVFVLGIYAGLAGPAEAAKPPPGSKVVVMHDGRSMVVKSYEVVGDVVKLRALDGSVLSVRTSEVNLQASREATRKLNAPASTPKPTPKEKSLTELAKELREKRRRRRQQSDEPVTQVPPPTPTGGTGRTGTSGGDTGPEVQSTPEPVAPPTATPVVPTPTPVPRATPPPMSSSTPPSLPSAPSGETETPESEGGGLGFLPLAVGGVALLAALGVGGFMLMRRKGAASPAKAAPASAADSDDDGIFEPAFASEEAEELPPPPEVGETPGAAEAPGDELPAPEPVADAQAESPQWGLPAPSVLPDTGELQIRIGTDVYTCPDVSTLKQWIEEGRVLENSEILSPSGQWLLAGTIPDLEGSFEAKNQ